LGNTEDYLTRNLVRVKKDTCWGRGTRNTYRILEAGEFKSDCIEDLEVDRQIIYYYYF
jgi:hypothetical protein